MAVNQDGAGEIEETVVWVKYYSSFHQILLVGEGDFSFSSSLARSFGSASNIVASSLDTYGTLVKKYKDAKSNLEQLEKLGATLLHGVDATRMKFHTDLRMRKFDRIIFNFPHAGFHGKEEDIQLINLHRSLVQGFFRNASSMLRPYGEIHVNHKTKAPYCHWNLEQLGSRHSLALIECVEFKQDDYPGYNNKRGNGTRCDEPFHLGDCRTFKFAISHRLKRAATQLALTPTYTYCPTKVQAAPLGPLQFQWHSSFQVNFPCADVVAIINNSLGHMVASTIRGGSEVRRIFDGYFVESVEMFGRMDYDVRRSTLEMLRRSFETYMSGESSRNVNDYITHLEELHSLMILRSAQMRKLLLRL
nr:TPA_asm: hypothetical protein HUJ06_025189 [Nelumbo nucifera]